MVRSIGGVGLATTPLLNSQGLRRRNEHARQLAITCSQDQPLAMQIYGGDRELMADATAEAALVFTCNGRGTRLFGSPDHDATVIHDALDGVPVAGMACAGEIGPVGTKNFLHGFTASVALFRKG